MFKKILLAVLLLSLVSSISFLAAYFYLNQEGIFKSGLLSPRISQESKVKELPLLQYSIENLAQKNFEAKKPIKIEKIISNNPEKKTYILLFSYESQGKNISGALNLKLDQASLIKPVILMIRGFVPLEGYFSGAGTKNAAAVLAENGYATLAPDFFGYGESDAEPSNTWESRFIKVANVIDLLRTVEAFPEIDLSVIEELPVKKIALDASKIGIWAHSNGGQIAISTLEVLGSNLPTTLWAPVLAPFPYSIMYFTDENDDEGKEARKYLSQLEADYDVFDFSLTKHLDRLNGPIQIQHGTNDDSALISWTEGFLAKVDLENESRATASSELTTQSAAKNEIKIDFHKYPGANHNLQPNWDEAIQKDLSFFAKKLLK